MGSSKYGFAFPWGFAAQQGLEAGWCHPFPGSAAAADPWLYL